MNDKKSGLRKAVIVLSTLGAEDMTLCGDVMKHVMTNLKEAEQKMLKREFLGSDSVIPPDEKSTILQDFYGEIMEHHNGGYLTSSERRKIIKTLPSTISDEEIIDGEIEESFGFVKWLTPDEIYSAIRHENPQAIALILSLLTPEKSAKVLSKITQSNIRNNIAKRIAEMNYISDDTLNDVAETLKARLNINFGKCQMRKDGPKTLAQILVRMNATAQHGILEKLQTEKPATAKEVQDNLFVFEDINHIDDNTMRLVVLKEIDYLDDLPKALKDPHLSDKLKQKFEQNMGRGQWQQVMEVMYILGDNIPLAQVKEAQRKIIDKISILESTGQITINRDFNAWD